MTDWPEREDWIEYHLGRLDEQDAERVRSRMRSDPGYAAEGRAIERLLRLLDAYTVDVPADLADRISAAVDRRRGPIRLAPEPADRGGFGGGMVSVRDAIAAAAMLAIAVALLVPAYVRAREVSRRTACQAQLRNIGYGVMAYAATYGSNLPFAGHRAGAYWMPVRKTGVRVNDNRRHVYLLVRNKFARPAWFVCPDRADGVVMVADKPEAFSTFPESANCTYSFQCMAGARPKVGEHPGMPIMADQTPLFRRGRSARACDGECNSPNHSAAGQNVLRADGVVRWSPQPDAGIGGDNIWLLKLPGLTRYTGREVPTSRTDAFLVP